MPLIHYGNRENQISHGMQETVSRDACRVICTINLQVTRGGGIHHLRFFAYYTCCIWNKIL